MTAATSTVHRSMTLTEWGLLIALSILWGGSFFFNGIAVKQLPFLVIVTCRVGLAAAVLNLVLALTGQRLPLNRPALGAFLAMGLLNNVIPFALIVWGQTHIASGLAAILNAMTPIFSILVAHLLTEDEKITGRKLAGVLCGVLGVAVLVGPSVIGGLGGGNMLAQLAVLGAAVSYGFASVFGRRFKGLGIPPLSSACGQVSASTLLLLPIMLWVNEPWRLPMPGLGTIAAVVGLATLSTALAYVIFFRILATAGATNLSLVTLLVPVSALILGVLLLAEHIDLRQIAGMLLITLGLVAIDGRVVTWLANLFGRRRVPRAG